MCNAVQKCRRDNLLDLRVHVPAIGAMCDESTGFFCGGAAVLETTRRTAAPS